MVSRPKPRTKTTDLDPRNVVVYFRLAYQIDEIQDDRNEPDSPTHELAKELWADPNLSNDLERRALRELAGMLGVRISTEGTGDNDVDCKILSVSTWYDVDRLWDKIQRHTTGGDDVITLFTPYMEASNFVLYPRGVNGPRYGSGEKDGGIPEWLEEHTPSPKIGDSVATVAGGVLLATWSDGTGLWRVTGSVQGKPYRSLVQLELWRDGGRLASLLLWGPGVSGDRFYEDYEFTVAKDKDLYDVRRRLRWFFVRNLPSSVMESYISDAIVDDLGFPRVLPTSFVALLEDHPLEERALQIHGKVALGRINADLDLFEEVRVLVEGEAGEESQEGYSFLVDSVEGNRYWVFHGRLSGPSNPRGRRYTMDEEYSPNWAVKTRWIEATEEAASWYVLNDNSTVTGAGRTPLQAIENDPSLVIPGRTSEWEKRQLDPGSLVFDPQIYLLLGEWPAVLWTDEAFLAFVKGEEA